VSFAVFLDRDGTIVVNKHYLADPDGLELLPNAAAGLRELRDLGARLVVVTNQSGVGRGYFDEAALAGMHSRLEELLEAEGIELAGIYACPHAPDAGCDCRKPATALYEQAAREHGLELSSSFVLGDGDADVEAGRRIGATSIRLGSDGANDELAAPDLLAAAGLIRSLAP
jgi:D-glycero-D-manno-heptose 1,7-bisphosphate phosphatase